MFDAVKGYMPWGSAPQNKSQFVSICDIEGELGVALKMFNQFEIESEDSEETPKNQLECNRITLMRELGQKVNAYSTFWIYIRGLKKTEMNLDKMGSKGIIRVISMPAETSEDAIYLKICKKSDHSHQILIGLFEERIPAGYMSEEKLSWSLKVCEAPEDSRFVEKVSIPIIQRNVPSLSLSLDVSSSIYRSEKLSGLTVRNMLTKLISAEEVQLDETYCLWNKHFEG